MTTCRRISRVLSLLALALTAGLAHAGDAVKVPKHRGPLKAHEMRRIVTQLRGTVVKDMVAEGKRAHAALSSGASYASNRFELIDAFQGHKYLVPKGRGITEERQLGDVDHALVTRDGAVHVQLHVARQESGKPSATQLNIRFNPGESIDAPSGQGSMLISEARTSASNGRTPNARLTMRSYHGPDWESSETVENDGNGLRNGKKVGFGGRDTTYLPGGRMGVWNDQTKRFDPAKGKPIVQ
jgi:hypothetical protein